MKKLILSILFILCLSFQASAWNPMVVVSGTSGVATGTDFTQNANCMGAWYMNAASGNETDRSGEGVTLVETSTPNSIPGSATVPSGYSGASRDFELDDSEYLAYAESNGNNVDISGADQTISLGGWIKIETDGGTDQTLIAKHGVSGQYQYYLHYDDSNSAWRVIISNDGTTSNICIGTTDTTAGVWQHIFVVYNDTDIRLYINGQLDSNGASNPLTYSNGIFNGNANFQVGGRGTEMLDGLIDEPIVFNRALSAAEVLEIYTYGISGNKGGND